ncbi:hypothetical protein CTTA_2317 [Comamonas testosteroni]|uniref:ABC transporter substrate-binding protein n=1 Tax=Comamonas testosteroni TaxID=285 RepID=A0A5A7MCA4_COMTE|nr:tripartite tricarboxylate transporter substrate binding protein [Comamonas testosteroni]GEQ75312.1 hypothetical protein CTTA_2317 [Comamonas testosteroni]
MFKIVIATSIFSASFYALAEYPAKPITMLVPYAAGGSTDVLARATADHLSRKLGKAVIVENIGGVGGVPGIMKFMRAPNDGYYLMFSNMGSYAIANNLYKSLNFDARTQIEAIGIVADVPMMLAASKASGFKNLNELLASMKPEGAKLLNLGNGGPGGTSHIGSEYFLYVSKKKALQVPYKGTGPAITDLMAGTTDIVIDQTTTLIPASKGGRILPLAVTSDKRLSEAPDVPTFREAGLPEFDISVWNAISAPKNTPRDKIEVIVKALNEVLNDKDFRKSMENAGASVPEIGKRGPIEMQKLIAAEVPKFQKLIREAHIVVN